MERDRLPRQPGLAGAARVVESAQQRQYYCYGRAWVGAATVVGTVVYTVMLPFTLLGGNEDEAAETLVKTPARTTFLRCLGCTPTQHDRLRRDKQIEAQRTADK